MRSIVAALLAAGTLVAAGNAAAERAGCPVPENLLLSDSQLRHVSDIAAKQRRLNIVVVGTGSSALAGPDGPGSAYPARLETTLRQRLRDVAVRVVALVRTRLTALDLARGMNKLLVDERPDLVIWQTGTIDAIRRIDPDVFRAALDDGVERLHRGGADVILMNMQYSPRTESMIAVDPYAENMRAVAQQRSVPLFDRLGIMRYWSEVGAFDFYASGRDNMLAQRVHNCIGRAIASLIVQAGELQKFEPKAGQ